MLESKLGTRRSESKVTVLNLQKFKRMLKISGVDPSLIQQEKSCRELKKDCRRSKEKLQIENENRIPSNLNSRFKTENETQRESSVFLMLPSGARPPILSIRAYFLK